VNRTLAVAVVSWSSLLAIAGMHVGGVVGAPTAHYLAGLCMWVVGMGGLLYALAQGIERG
jgi:hypothetical protein